MISIQSAMLVALGFLLASLIALLLASAFWGRAVRLTTARIKQSLPVSEQEIQADRDRLRAEHAVRVHKLETEVEQMRLARARQLIELNRRDASIAGLETSIAQLKAEIEGHENARRVLEQTVTDRLPKVEARLAEAKRLLLSREREIGELHQSARRNQLALEEAASINAQQAAQIDRLTAAVAARGGSGKTEAEVALRTELEALRAKTRDQASLIDRLLRSAGAARAAGAAGRPGTDGAAGESQTREVIAEAEAVLSTARAAASGSDKTPAALEGELRALKTKTAEQASEIGRLKAALAAVEQGAGKEGDGKETRAALQARLGSAEAQADQQSATIGRLRAELAAVNERLAHQAAHFMDEMRRLGGATAGAASPPRAAATRPERRPLAERVSQIRSRPAAVPADKAAQAGETSARPDAPAGNGEAARAADPLPAPAAAESPKAGDIPAEPRRLRLLDRISSLAKE